MNNGMLNPFSILSDQNISRPYDLYKVVNGSLTPTRAPSPFFQMNNGMLNPFSILSDEQWNVKPLLQSFRWIMEC